MLFLYLEKVALAAHPALQPKGRAMKRLKYNRRFVNVVVGFGKKR